MTKKVYKNNLHILTIFKQVSEEENNNMSSEGFKTATKKWVYQPGDDVLPTLMSGQTLIIIAIAIFTMLVVIPDEQRTEILKLVSNKQWDTVFFSWYRSIIRYVLIYCAMACVSSVIIFLCEASIFKMKNRELLLTITPDEYIDLAFLFLRPMAAASLIWPYSLLVYTYKYAFLKFYVLMFTYLFEKA